MKIHIQTIILIFALILASCTDVIEVPVQTATTRLVIEASIDWEKGTSGNEQTIRLRKSTAFYDATSNTAVTGATVMISNDTNGDVFIFVDQNNGEYVISEFVPVLGHSYTLEVIHNGETYTAKETLISITDITGVYQDRKDGFDDEELELHVEFTDPANDENFYLFRFQRQGDLLPQFEVGNDKFINGKEVDWWYEIQEDDDTDKIDVIQPGDLVSIEMHGISEAYYDYMYILINQIGGVGVFDPTPVAVKGNCMNLTNPQNFAYGYFRLTQVNKANYTFE